MFAAFAVAYLAKAGFLERPSVLMLRERVLQLTGGEGDIWECVEHFCAAYEHCRRVPVAVAELGDRLAESIKTLSLPVPPGSDRKDTHG